mmetsp:Transcript_77167/g.186493  ORF Transcript_77167/g.186493 Transcript_77167/m.186493 type:complete len:235 (+) Transcript_77167:1488-2192(+)
MALAEAAVAAASSASFALGLLRALFVVSSTGSPAALPLTSFSCLRRTGACVSGSRKEKEPAASSVLSSLASALSSSSSSSFASLTCVRTSLSEVVGPMRARPQSTVAPPSVSAACTTLTSRSCSPAAPDAPEPPKMSMVALRLVPAGKSAAKVAADTLADASAGLRTASALETTVSAAANEAPPCFLSCACNLPQLIAAPPPAACHNASASPSRSATAGGGPKPSLSLSTKSGK